MNEIELTTAIAISAITASALFALLVDAIWGGKNE